MDEAYLVEHYVNQGKSMADIARENHCSRQTVFRSIKKYGIPSRDRSQSRQKALENGKFKDMEKRTIDDAFFEPSHWSPGMAWVLGLLFADGNMEASRPVFRLSQRDPEGLHKVLKLMRSTHMVSLSEKKSYKGVISGKIYSFKVWNQKIYNDLLHLGLRPAKTPDMTFPEVPPALMNHFVRGLYDGDGSFYINRFDGQKISQYRNRSREFINSLAVVLQNQLGVPVTVHPHGHSNSYYFKIRQKLNELVTYLYKGASEAIYFSEKFNKIKKVIENS